MDENQKSNVVEQYNNQDETNEQINVAPGSDVEIIKVNTPSFFQSHFLHLLIVFGLGFLTFIYIFEIHFTRIYVVGESMQPTINASVSSNNDKTHIDQVYFRAKNSYDVGDIVIADATDYLTDESRTIIKRVIATAGQTVTFKNLKQTNAVANSVTTLIAIQYELYIDGQKLAENYIKDQTCYLAFRVGTTTGNYADSTDYTLTDSLYSSIKSIPVYNIALDMTQYIKNEDNLEYSYTVPEDCVFICGDNRNHSTDSRYFGAVKQNDILGNVRLHVKYKENLFVSIWHQIFGSVRLAY